MNIITLVILTLSLLLVNANQHCDNLYRSFKQKCDPLMITIKSCCDVLKTFSPQYAKSGVYKLSKGTFDNSVNVYCDMNTTGGGWIVIQRNRRGSTVDFSNKKWIDYERGFGDTKTEFWYGLDAIHCFTETGQWEMRVDYQKSDKTWSYLHYNQFSVGSASEEYPLTVGGFTGEGADRFNYHNGHKFSINDNDNDNWQSGNKNCAVDYKSGWWYHNNGCYHINLNRQPPRVVGSVLFTEMKIRPKDCITH